MLNLPIAGLIGEVLKLSMAGRCVADGPARMSLVKPNLMARRRIRRGVILCMITAGAL